MKILIRALSLAVFLTVCQKESKILYQSDEFTIYTNKVEQGTHVAKIVSETKIVSNYRSLVHENYSRLITFKFSINEKDNEKPPLADHWLIIGDEHESPLIRFGQENSSVPDDPGTWLPANYTYTFRLDMKLVIQQFKEKGYYQAYDGSRIAGSDFKTVYIAGGSEPMTWDFARLEEKDLALKDPDGDGIYEITLVLNPYNPDKQTSREWSLTEDITGKPQYSSDQPIVDALFKLSLEEALKNIESDSTLRTGAKWDGVWTRDVSYSTLLAFACHEPEIAKKSLMCKVKRGRIIQDTGSGGAWPVSSDRTTWALAAWEIYKVTGDPDWLIYAYNVIKNTLDDDYKTLTSKNTGLLKGESSFLDWREQTYPKWMSNADIYASENLGTNVVHYQAHCILVEMAKLLGKPYEVYEERAAKIKKSINDKLWMEDKGYYGQYRYGRSELILSPRFEALGESLAVLFDVAGEEKARSVLANSPITPFGVTCIYPQIPGIPPYHNNAIWPFVQSFWNLAAAKVGNEEALNHGLASIYRAGALFLSNYENFVAQNGDYVGTEINSDRMLWSMAGNMAMVYRVFIGVHFEPDGIRFQPVIPENYNGTRKLSGFTYRNAHLNIEVVGFGKKIQQISLDGKPLEEAFLPASVSGDHEIKIVMANEPLAEEGIHQVKNRFSPESPETHAKSGILTWDLIKGAVKYNVYRNGTLYTSTPKTRLELDTESFSEYMVTAVDDKGYESFSSEPVLVCEPAALTRLEIEDFAGKSSKDYSNYSGRGFTATSTTENKNIDIEIDIKEAGKYRVDFRYSNGTGPWNTDNNCAIRSLYVNNEYEGVVVMPQRGKDEWSDWGFTNSIIVRMKKGKNSLRLTFEEWNTNMDGEINEAMLDYLRLIKM